jgi:G3E family GTPase
MTDYAGLTPINIVTGFLGSGKTTLLQRLLRAPRLDDVVVLVNEFGEVGLDHQLLQAVAESTLLLENGCLCCAVRGDLRQALRDLLSRRMRGDIPFFRRVVIETSGLADPVPIAYTLLAEPVIRHHFRLSAILTTVDAVNATAQLDTHAEAVKQIAVADRIILTKTDLAEAAAVRVLRARITGLNRSAPVLDTGEIGADGALLLVDDIYDAAGKAREISRWLDAGAPAAAHDHTDDVQSFCLTFDRPLDWTAFGVWATLMLHRHGAEVLRLKGVLNVEGVATPVLINGVQHIVHPPSHLDAWPDADRRSRLIFIVRGLARQRVERSLAAFNALVNTPTRLPA